MDAFTHGALKRRVLKDLFAYVCGKRTRSNEQPAEHHLSMVNTLNDGVLRALKTPVEGTPTREDGISISNDVFLEEHGAINNRGYFNDTEDPVASIDEPRTSMQDTDFDLTDGVAASFPVFPVILRTRSPSLLLMGSENTPIEPDHPPLAARYAEIIVYQDERGEKCSAMALTKEMVHELNVVIRYEQKIKNLKREISLTERTEKNLDVDIRNMSARFEALEAPRTKSANALSQDLDDAVAYVGELRVEKTNLKHKLSKAEEELSDPKSSLLGAWSDVLANCNLLEPRPVEKEERQSQADYKPEEHHPKPRSLTLSEKVRASAEEERDAAIDFMRKNEFRLQEAKQRVDNWDSYYNREYHAYQKCVAAGEMEEARSFFDGCLLRESREAIADLAWAEDEFEKARQQVRKLGIILSDMDQQSGFVDYPDDGYRESMEAAMVAHVDHDSIQKWMQGEDDSRNHSTECDQWDSRSVDLCDSVSVVAQGRDRKRIDRWRSACDMVEVKKETTEPPELPQRSSATPLAAVSDYIQHPETLMSNNS